MANRLHSFQRVLFFFCVVKPFLKLVLGINIFGREHLPRDEQVILVANHNSHLDAMVLLSLFPFRRLHQIHPVAASDYFTPDQWSTWFASTFLNILPIPRSNFSKSDNPLLRMEKALDAGQSLIIFPEGSRGYPEQLSEFKSGIGHLLRKHPNLPVIPVFLKGMGRSLPKGEVVLIPFFCDILIGQPQRFSGSKDEITHAVMEAIVHLQNQWEDQFGCLESQEVNE